MDFYSDNNVGYKPALWDSFQDPPTWRASGSEAKAQQLRCLLKICKILVYLSVFCVILTTAFISQLTVLVLVANLGSEVPIKYCNFLDKSEQYLMLPTTRHKSAALWALILCFSAPEIFTFLRALRFVLFKGVQNPTWLEVLLVSLFELLHILGLAVLISYSLPKLDSFCALLLFNCVSFIPTFLNLRLPLNRHCKNVGKFVLAIFAFLAQLWGVLVWPIISNNIQVQMLPLPLLLISMRWWENYIFAHTNLASLVQNLSRRKSKYKIYLYLAPLKILLFTFLCCTFNGNSYDKYIEEISYIWQPYNITIMRTNPGAIFNSTTMLNEPEAWQMNKLNVTDTDTITLQSNPSTNLYTVLLQVCSAYICFGFAKFATKIKIQEFSMALALNLAPLATLLFIFILLQLRESHVCLLHGYVPDYYTLKSHHFSTTQTLTLLTLWLCSWLSHIYITKHLWLPKNDKNAPTDKLFICPGYSGLLVPQCVALNRRIVDWSEHYTFNMQHEKHIKRQADKVPKLLVCATMWHETAEEMIKFLKSILRLDEDQCARRLACQHINRGKRDAAYYDLEVHIFFDDAFVEDKRLFVDEHNPPLNKYVQSFIENIEKAAFEVFGVQIQIKSPKKIETPYGGRLKWVLPGRNEMIVHLKNKKRIRHKKRWSQVMYMYYLLGYRIMQLPNVSARRKAIIAENTYLLALDGDIDFQPQAVHLLIDRMKAIDDLGAACGRIHPVGCGPMVWYQKFEYAIGHWLQKATEHVIGCVLCSPGCFSLFRGSALMENNVIKKYTTVSQEPMNYIQYDQGEDRWLCTLLLKQGLRVEYSAAADAFTHAPETFNEFYNQRRRWVPSTLANILDLLGDAHTVVRNNNSISTPYILYQMMLTVGTILSPGTIFLMMVGAVVAVFDVNIWTAFLWNFCPVLVFMLSCIYIKQQMQLLLAFCISTLYCLVMMAVLIGVIIQIIEDGPLAPASLFFLLLFLQILIAGLLHPQEVGDLVCGIIYYITIPSMYMLLMIYSVFNMNDVSWGTREIVLQEQIIDSSHSNNNNMNNDHHHQHHKNELVVLPGWMDDPLLLEAQLDDITIEEKRFWKDLIRQYLRPLYQSKINKEEVKNNLKNMRNIFAFAFIMINAIFVLIVFLLQLKKDFLHLEWPIDPIDFITYDNMNSQIFIYRRYKELDPIGMCFILFFGLLLIIQFVAMFFHRFATFSQLMAATQLNWFFCKKKLNELDEAQVLRGNAVHIARQLQLPKCEDDFEGSDDEYLALSSASESESESEHEQETAGSDLNDIWTIKEQLKRIDDVRNSNFIMKRQPTVCKLHANQHKKQQDRSDLPTNFERRFYGTADIELKLKHKNQSISLRRSKICLQEKAAASPPPQSPQPPQTPSEFTSISLYDNVSFKDDDLNC